jgi:DNA-binding NarL/FixJ family response regulator
MTDQEPQQRPTVVLVDDHALFRAGVRAELDALVDIIGEAGDVDAAVREIVTKAPDVVLLDVHLPGGGGVEILRRLTTEAPDAKCLALSVSDDPEDVIAVIRAGARGYVTKTISATELVDAIRRVQDGDAVFSPRLAGFVLDAFAGGGSGSGSGSRSRSGSATGAGTPTSAAPTHDAELDQLTPREREVLRHIARGYLYKEIAQRLGISVKTVEAHVSAVLRKLQLSTRHELSRWAVERRLVD